MADPAPKRPHPAAGLVLFLVAVAAIFATTALSTDAALALTPVLVLGSTAAAIVIFRVDAAETLLLRRPALPDVAMAVPLAISFVVIGDQIGSLSHELFPIPDEFTSAMREVLLIESAAEWLTKIAVIGLGAAVSEELMFRGFIMSAFRSKGGRARAVVASALLFMLLHLQFVPTFAAGLLLGFTALATRSILVPITIHFVNNVSALLLINLAGRDTLAEPVWIPAEILLPALGIFVLTATYFARQMEPIDERAEAAPARPATPPPAAIHLAALARRQPKIADELASVPAGRRRLGWLVVAGALVGGMVVLVGLLATSLYLVHPERAHEAGIRLLNERSRDELSLDASDKSEALDSAFAALTALNESGQMEWTDLVRVRDAYISLSADGTLTGEDADALIEAIRRLVVEKTSAKPL